MLSLASLHCSSCSFDFLSLSLLGLVKDRQEDERAVTPHVVRDSLSCSAEVEPQFSEPPVELTGVRRAESRAEFGEPVDVEGHLTEVVIGERFQPVGDPPVPSRPSRT